MKALLLVLFLVPVIARADTLAHSSGLTFDLPAGITWEQEKRGDLIVLSEGDDKLPELTIWVFPAKAKSAHDAATKLGAELARPGIDLLGVKLEKFVAKGAPKTEVISDADAWRGTGTVNGDMKIAYAVLERDGVRLVAVALPKDGIFERGASLFDAVLHGLVDARLATFDLTKIPDAVLEARMKGDDDSLSQVFAKDARFVVLDEGKLVGPADVGLGVEAVGQDVKDVAATVSADGRSAWLSYTTKIRWRVDRESTDVVDYRVSEVLTKARDGWRIVGGMWSNPQPNGTKSRPLPKLEATNSDAGLRDAYQRLWTHPLDATAAANKALVAIGSAAGERTVGGAVLAKAWSQAWMNHVSAAGDTVAVLAPGGTTGWVTSDVTLGKTTFRLFLVFDRGPKDWTLVHVHFAAAPP